MLTVRILKDRFYKKMSIVLVFSSWAVLLMFISILILRSLPVIARNNIWELIISPVWQPTKGKFGLLAYILSTAYVTLLAIIFAFPTCLLAALFLSEYTPQWLKKIFIPVIDLLAGIPSVVYGLWGTLIIVPFIKKMAEFFFKIYATGYSMISAAIVLSVMLFPILINIFIAVFDTIPKDLRLASYAVGATKWETIKKVVLKKGLPGIIAGVILAISRAAGETMAVLMVAGNVAKIPRSLFDPAYPLPALIANSYGELLSIPSYESILMLSAIILMLIVVFFNLMSRFILYKIRKGIHL